MNPLERRSLILKLLGLEPRLTAAQVAKLAYPTDQTIQVSGKTYPKTYQSANNMLRRMASRRELKCQSFDTEADWFMLNTTHRIKDYQKYRHEWGAAELFVSFYPYLREQSGQWAHEFPIRKDRADRAMRLFGKTIFFEVDRATESPREIEGKLDNYVQYGNETGERFHVVFALMDGTETTAHARGNKLIPLLQERRRGNQFLLCHLTKITADPLGQWLYSPTDELYSLQDVI